MDPNWIMAIIAISAVVSPSIVAIVDNVCKYKIKKLDLSYDNKQKALSEFVQQSLMIFTQPTYSDLILYNIAKNNLYVYFKDINEEYFKDLDLIKKQGNLEDYQSVLNKFIKELSSQIKK